MSGEEIIGDVVEKDNDPNNPNIVIRNPCLLQIVPSRTNSEQPMMGMYPYAVYTEDHAITVNTQSIIWKEKPVTELYNQYNSAFGSGIQLATL